MKPQIMRYWTTQELRLAMTLWRNGETVEKMAEALGRNVGSVKDQISRNRMMFPRRKERGTKENPIEYVEFKVNLTKAQHRKLKIRAGEQGVSMSMFIRNAISESLK